MGDDTGHAHQAIDDMAGRVQTMSQLVEGIWESTFAQGSGINLLGEAVQVAVSSNEANLGLVQQATQTAARLDDQAHVLALVLERFRTTDDGGPVGPGVPGVPAPARADDAS